MRVLGTGILALVLAACGGRAPPVAITGRVEAPAGVDLADVTVLAYRGSVPAPWTRGTDLTQYKGGPLKFALGVSGTDPVTLIVARLPWVGEDGRVGSRNDADRQIYAVGSTWGMAQDVRPGAQDVVIRLEHFVAARLRVRALDPDGRPSPGCPVRLSLAERPDWMAAVSDTQGIATFQDVPVATWTVEVDRRRGDSPHLVAGRLEVRPADQLVDVALRRGVLVRVTVRGEVPAEAVLAFRGADDRPYTLVGWLEDAAGGMYIAAEPQWDTVSVSLHDARLLAQATTKVHVGAHVELVIPD